MGREVHRVPLDFDWPMKKRWKGYVNPYYHKCPRDEVDCFGGETAARRRLADLVYLIMLSGSNSVEGKCHPWLWEAPLMYTRGKVPGKDMAELTGGLADRACRDGAIGHDSSDAWRAVNKVIEAAGLDPKTWGRCPVCKGEGMHPDYQDAYDAWVRTDPPRGEGWQMWETTSEGSPISPVFETPEELAQWLADTEASTFGSMTADYDTWLNMIKGSGWAPSGVVSSEGIKSGVEAAARWSKEDDDA